ncbi:MAG: GlsB/YeaQ/YmgE family stress response membrane protein [Pantoea sp.]|uniref:GlsB/YeaQ/YmgE family stress response membrane protein n=1 Tax=Pantoea sp. TaxID=69393 RepID=UPI000EB85847|nr:GlsB/YeaQ/YmgE family stress response membrane protein [Pantoea sp.]MDU6079382.1 GlsB/YeaQ/YmgE family stress response membrane protein [Pantoea sp.]MDU7836717.1 GlsB/YeaQ/YmgE family stress response membrane protein [Pantoea sp.]HAB24088.1 GlsB/YeaQ/YmgE family stress response membrane protein [Pantoea sp.]
MGISSWIFFGLVAGILARCIMPGKEHLGIIMTILLGVTGALIGGVISTALGFGKVSGFNLYSILISTAGAIIVLFVVHKIRALKQA